MKAIAIFIASILMGVAALGICIFAGAAGHGTYLPAKILFPFTMISTGSGDTITITYLLVAIMQFPFYGLVVAIGQRFRRLLEVSVFLISFHVVAVIGALFLSSKYFS
jgi:hypothetical protein